jgi:methylated-DNA-[protein]-cysteine S-methyltransferase
VAPTVPDRSLSLVTYTAQGWGVGELVFRGDQVVQHEDPTRRIVDDAPPVSAAQWQLVARLQRYFAGERVAFDDVDVAAAMVFCGATAFEQAITRCLQRVAYGETVSYAQLAVFAGRPGAHRAAGSALARGTLPVLVPYHRVIRSDGTAGVFGRDGASYKRRLLRLEGVDA